MTGKSTNTLTAVTLVADIGGTNARFALALPERDELQFVKVLPCAEFDGLKETVLAYLGFCHEQRAPMPLSACFAVAGAVDQDAVRLTNNPWQFSQAALSSELSLPVTVINDFSAQAWCLPHVKSEHLHWLQCASGQQPESAPQWLSGTRCVAGPGTGFGAAAMTLSGDVLECEPGLCAFAPLNTRQADMLRQLWKSRPRVCHDMLLSGAGLVNICHALMLVDGHGGGADYQSARDVLDAARQHEPLAMESTRMFSAILGSVCGDLALTLGSTGGFFLSGALLRGMAELFHQDIFLKAFNNKGAYSDWCQRLPVALWHLPQPGLEGCAEYARRHG